MIHVNKVYVTSVREYFNPPFTLNFTAVADRECTSHGEFDTLVQGLSGWSKQEINDLLTQRVVPGTN